MKYLIDNVKEDHKYLRENIASNYGCPKDKNKTKQITIIINFL